MPADPLLVSSYIAWLADTKHSSGSIRRTLGVISIVHRLKRLEDVAKDPEVTIEMRRMHRKLGQSCKQTNGVTSDILDSMLAVTENNLRGMRDRALLRTAYDTLYRRNKIVLLRTEDIREQNKNSVEQMSILLRRSKADQES